MKLKELKARVRVLGSAGYGHKKVEIVYKGKSYTFITTSTLATDRLLEYDYVFDRKCSGYYTLKQAYQALWDEGKSKMLN
jgi:guanylate kinase